MKHLLTTSLLAFLLSVTISCDKIDKEPEPPQMPIKGIVSSIRMELKDNTGEVYSGDFSIEYDKNGNITKLGAPANYEDGRIFYYKRQGDKLIVTHAWSYYPQELTDEKLEATLDDKGRAVTAVRTWDKGAGGKVGTENLVFHYSDNGEIKDHSSDYEGLKFEYTWKDGNIISTKTTSLDNTGKPMSAQQISSPYENRTNIDFADISNTIADYQFGMMYMFNGLLRSSGYLGNMDKNLPEEVRWSDLGDIGATTYRYSYEFDDNGRPKSIVVTDYSHDAIPPITLKISYKN